MNQSSKHENYEEPTGPLDESLLSAYLDNELTDHEREQVIIELRSNVQWQKVLAELQQVRSLLSRLGKDESLKTLRGPWNQLEPTQAAISNSLVNSKSLHEEEQDVSLITSPLKKPLEGGGSFGRSETISLALAAGLAAIALGVYAWLPTSQSLDRVSLVEDNVQGRFDHFDSQSPSSDPSGVNTGKQNLEKSSRFGKEVDDQDRLRSEQESTVVQSERRKALEPKGMDVGDKAKEWDDSNLSGEVELSLNGPRSANNPVADQFSTDVGGMKQSSDLTDMPTSGADFANLRAMPNEKFFMQEKEGSAEITELDDQQLIRELVELSISPSNGISSSASGNTEKAEVANNGRFIGSDDKATPTYFFVVTPTPVSEQNRRHYSLNYQLAMNSAQMGSLSNWHASRKFNNEDADSSQQRPDNKLKALGTTEVAQAAPAVVGPSSISPPAANKAAPNPVVPNTPATNPALARGFQADAPTAQAPAGMPGTIPAPTAASSSIAASENQLRPELQAKKSKAQMQDLSAKQSASKELGKDVYSSGDTGNAIADSAKSDSSQDGLSVSNLSQMLMNDNTGDTFIPTQQLHRFSRGNTLTQQLQVKLPRAQLNEKIALLNQNGYIVNPAFSSQQVLPSMSNERASDLYEAVGGGPSQPFSDTKNRLIQVSPLRRPPPLVPDPESPDDVVRIIFEVTPPE